MTCVFWAENAKNTFGTMSEREESDWHGAPMPTHLYYLRALASAAANWSLGTAILCIVGLGVFCLSQSLVSGVNSANQSLLVGDFEQ